MGPRLGSQPGAAGDWGSTLTDLIDALEHFVDPIAFERLACDVLHRAGYPGLDPQGVGRRDGGKDALVRHPTFGAVVCHFSLRKDWERKLGEDVGTVIAHSIPCDHLVFVTTRRASPLQKDRMKVLVREQLGASLEVFDQERLRIVLAAEPELCQAYFPDVALPGTALQRIAAVLETLVDKGLIVPSPDQLATLPEVVDGSGKELLRLASYGRSEEALAMAQEIAIAAGQVVILASYQLLAAGAMFLEQQKVAEARRCFALSTVLRPEFYEGWFNLAVAREVNTAGLRYGHGMHDEGALAAYDRALALAPTDEKRAAVLEGYGVLLAKRGGELSEAVATLERARELDPSHLSVRMNWTVLALSGDELHAALIEFLGTDQDELARLNLASGAKDERDWASASTWLEGVGDHQDVVYASRLRCEIALGARNLELARIIAEELVLRDESDPWTHSHLGLIALARGDTSTAIAAFDRLVELTPDSGTAHLQLGKALVEDGSRASIERATNALLTSIRLGPVQPIMYLELGRCYVARGMRASARVEYVRALEVDPDYVIAHFNLGHLAEFRTDTERIQNKDNARQALPHYLKALEIDPDYYPALVNAGADYVILDDATRGIELLERARALDGEEPTMLCNLALGYAKAGGIARATVLLSDVLAADPNNAFAKALLRQLEHGRLAGGGLRRSPRASRSQ